MIELTEARFERFDAFRLLHLVEALALVRVLLHLGLGRRRTDEAVEPEQCRGIELVNVELDLLVRVLSNQVAKGQHVRSVGAATIRTARRSGRP